MKIESTRMTAAQKETFRALLTANDVFNRLISETAILVSVSDKLARAQNYLGCERDQMISDCRW